MWWIALVACQDRAVEIVGRLAHIDPTVTHRAAPAPEPEPAAEAPPPEPAKPIDYNPVSTPQESKSPGYSMPGVGRKRPGVEQILTD